MSRINEDWEPDCIEDELRGWAFQGNIRRAVAGKKGRKFLIELEAALLALPEKRLASGAMAASEGMGGFDGKPIVATGDVCALGAVAVARALAAGKSRQAVLRELAEKFDPEEQAWTLTTEAAHYLKICHPLAYAVVYQNDVSSAQTPEKRYENVLAWVQRKLKGEPEY